VWDSLARIERQVSKVPAQAEQGRTPATELNVNGALINDPQIQSATFRIADEYQRMTFKMLDWAAKVHTSRKARSSQQFPAAADQASALAPASARTRPSSLAKSSARPANTTRPSSRT
jgi:hypothetical protein